MKNFVKNLKFWKTENPSGDLGSDNKFCGRKNPKFWKTENPSGDLVDRVDLITPNFVESYLFTKFGINLLDGFCENASYGRTEGPTRDTPDTVKQS